MLRVSDVRMHEEPDAVTLTIKAPEEARKTVDALFEPFLSAKGLTWTSHTTRQRRRETFLIHH